MININQQDATKEETIQAIESLASSLDTPVVLINTDAETIVKELPEEQVAEIIEMLTDCEEPEPEYIIEFLDTDMTWSKANITTYEDLKDLTVIDNDFDDNWTVVVDSGIIYRFKEVSEESKDSDETQRCF